MNINNLLIKNKKANFNYDISDKYIAGMVLKGTEIKSLKEWEKHIERVREFARKRPEIVRNNFLKHFELEKVIQIKTESTSGLISINSIRIPEKSNAGKYFSNVPIRLFVYEDEGAEFAHWMINGKIYFDKSLDIKLSSDSKIIAVYK